MTLSIIIPCLRRRFSRVRAALPPPSFITIYYANFIIVPLVCSLIFWGSSDPTCSVIQIEVLASPGQHVSQIERIHNFLPRVRFVKEARPAQCLCLGPRTQQG